ncbi:MAG: SDR family NAD(P)-dependent oxidoreductase, partial [Actinomycetota bacterium]
MDLGLGGRAILITGASGGIGLATARAVAREGARVAIAARSADRLEAAVAELAALGAPDALTIVADLARPGEPERAVAEAAARFGGLD